MKSTPTDQPPSYEYVTNGSKHDGSQSAPESSTLPLLSKPSMPQTTVYYYSNPLNQDRITSLLPPDHPEMICLQQGSHIRETHFGLLGIIVAVIWFPLGVGLCLLDRRVKCKRCGMILQDGFCG